jgi:hypothetical protein
MSFGPSERGRRYYHRVKDLERLRALALHLPLLVTDDDLGGHRQYGVRQLERYPDGGTGYHPDVPPLIRGRYEVIYAYLSGWRHATKAAEAAGRVPS